MNAQCVAVVVMLFLISAGVAMATTAQVLSISFVSNTGTSNEHTLYFDGTSDGGWSDSTSPISDPVWQNGGTTNYPACYDRSTATESRMRVIVSVQVSPANKHYTFVGMSGIDAYFRAEGLVSTGSPQSVSMTALHVLPSTVSGASYGFGWKVFVGTPDPPEQINICNSMHTVYTTYNGLGGNPTLKRTHWDCAIAAPGASTAAGVADGVYNHLGEPNPPEPEVDPPWEPGEKPTLGSGWPLLDASGSLYGECDEQAQLMVYAAEMLGVDGDLRLVRASSNAGAGNCLDQEDRTSQGIHQYLILDFDTGGGYAWNAFEGCCEAAGSYYAIWPMRKATNDYTMLTALPCQQYWVKTYSDIEPGDADWDVQTVYDQQAKP